MSNARAHSKVGGWIKAMATIHRPMLATSKLAARSFAASVDRNFDKEIDPYGKKWKPRTRGYRWKPLKKTNKMRGSWSVTSKLLTITFRSSDPKAIFHHKGTRMPDNSQRMPARTQSPRDDKPFPQKWFRVLDMIAISQMKMHFK